jgi:hypothetical protein
MYQATLKSNCCGCLGAENIARAFPAGHPDGWSAGGALKIASWETYVNVKMDGCVFGGNKVLPLYCHSV